MSGKKLYDILGVAPSATPSQLKKAYHELAKKLHPDKNPNAGDQFKEVTAAYDILSDPEKRQIYDEEGEDGLKRAFAGQQGGSNWTDAFSNIFSNFFGRAEQRPGDKQFNLNVTLSDLYKGCVKKLRLSRNVTCTSCNGEGSQREGAAKTCLKCRGTGIKTYLHQLGPGMAQQIQQTCPDCMGQKQIIPVEDRCPECCGTRTVQKQDIVEVKIAPGMSVGTRITVPGMGEEHPGQPAGNLIAVLQGGTDERFTRNGDNLLLRMPISLAEALLGFETVITHLDGRRLGLKHNKIVRPGEVYSVMGEGMRTSFGTGDLLLLFEVLFPKDGELDDEKRNLLRQVLPSVDKNKESESETQVTMKRVHHSQSAPKNKGPGCVHQ